MPQILIDENLPITVMTWLKKRGLNVIRASEAGLRGAKDENIAKYAIKNNMIILTLDTDFAYIYYNVFRGSLTVIVVRIKPPDTCQHNRSPQHNLKEDKVRRISEETRHNNKEKNKNNNLKFKTQTRKLHGKS